MRNNHIRDGIRPRVGLASLTALVLLAFASPALAWTGKVVKITDGDTITVLARNHKQVKIRLYGVDAPEKKQAYGGRSTDVLRRLAARKTVEVDVVATDNYGRSVAVVTASGERRSLNEAMLEAGLAWVYEAYCREARCQDWRELQEEARRRRLGLWADRSPTPPWEWRKTRHGREDDGFWGLLERLLR